MEKTPLVSIIMPVYNGANYMRQAIDSALMQTYPNIEIIVVNDGSTDDGETEKIALSYGDKIRYIKKENGGSSSALNTGIRHMQGEYFSWLSHDDLYTPFRVERVMEEMRKHPAEKTAVVCGYSLIDEKSNAIFYPKKLRAGHFEAEEMLRVFIKGQTINGCGICIAKKLLEKTGFFSETFRYVNDTDYWCRLINLGTDFVWLDEKLVKTRIHGGQVSVTSRELYHVENEAMLLRCIEDTLRQKKYNLTKLYARQSAYHGYTKNIKMLREEIKAISSIPCTAWECTFVLERLRGIVKQSAKRLYKLLIWKR